MGTAWSVLRRTVRAPAETRGNLQKVLDSEPKFAPKHDSTKELLETARAENQAAFDADNKKSEGYLSLLRKIHVDSVDVNINKKNEKEASSESSSTTKQTGRLTSEQLVFLFQQQMANPQEWDEEKIATHFHLPPKSVENLLKYYSDFNVEKARQLPEPLQDITT